MEGVNVMVDLKTAIHELNTGKIEFNYKDDDCCTTEGEVVILLKRLAELEKADVVEVVRCKDCKYKTFEQANNIIHCDRDRKQGTMFFKPDDFCSYGKRRDAP